MSARVRVCWSTEAFKFYVDLLSIDITGLSSS